MPYYLPTNPNSFRPRYRKYKQIRSDIWGNLAFLNKKNSFFTIMRRYAYLNLRQRIFRFRKKKAKRLRRAFKFYGTRRFFEFSIKKKKHIEIKQKPKVRYSLRLLRKKLILFYGFRLRRKPLRKLFQRANRGKIGRTFLETHRFRNPVPAKRVDLEARIDVLLYRLNFIHSVYEGRRFIREKRAFVMKPSPKGPKFFLYYTIRKYFHKVPYFHFITLRYDLALLRKCRLLNMIYAAKLLAYPPDYLMVDYRTMIGLRHMPILARRVRYPFQGTLAFFLGLAIYF